MNDDKKKTLLLNYVGNFIAKRNNELREVLSNDSISEIFDRNSVVINKSERDPRYSNLTGQASESTDIDCDELSLVSDPSVEIRDGGEQTQKQPIYIRQFQQPTPEPIDIEIQEIALKPTIQHPPIHVHVRSKRNRDQQRTPSPIVIKIRPPEPPLTSTNTPLVYNKFIPIDSKPPPRQIVIHHHPNIPPKPRPIIVEQWLPNKPAPKRITYRRINQDENIQNQTKHKRNRYIEYKKPHITIEVEIIRSPIIKMDPEQYRNQSNEFRSFLHNREQFSWRI